MELWVLWNLANIFVFNALQVYGSLPIPVLHFEERIIEELDTPITCTLPYNDCPDVQLVIKGNGIIAKNCIHSKGSNYPNVTCTVEVTQEMHEMEYTCEAQFKTQSLPRKLNIQTEPKFTDCPDMLVWLEGQENSFQCNATGYPLPTVICTKNNTIYKPGETFIAMRNMSGAYTCRATNFDTDKKEVMVSVEYKPKILSIKVSPSLRAEGDEVQITCGANGVPDPTYNWNTPSSDIQFSSDNRTVTIKSLKQSHLGNYTCIAQNKHGTDAAGQTLNRAEKPVILTFTSEPSTQVLEGTNVTMICDASGFPPPVLSWSTPVPDVELSQDNRTGRLWRVKKGHVGRYSCKAQNQYGSDTKSQTLTLAVKPKIVKIKIQPSKSVAEGENVTMTCEAEGVPAPSYNWETPIRDAQLITNKSVLNIWSAKKIHDGDYQCKVENKYGWDTQTEKISVQVPESKGNRGERRQPVPETILATLIFTSLFYYLC